MLIIDGTLGADVPAFLARMYEDTPPCILKLYDEWVATHSCSQEQDHPDGIIYLRVSPEIAYKRIQKRALPEESDITQDRIEQVYKEKEELFIENKNSPQELQHIPVMVLNGNIDFQTDFSQFYNHLFYIKKFLKEIQERKDIARGVYREKITQHRRCC